MKVKILRHKKDEVELAGSKRNDDVVVRVVEEEVGDSEGHSSDEGNMSDVWNGEREESGNEEQEVQRQKGKDLLFEREMRGEKEGKEKAATRARREELKGWKRISVDLGKKFPAKMRLYLVVVMLVLALAAFTQAQDAEAAVSGITEMGKSLADKAKATFEDIRNSDIKFPAKMRLYLVVAMLVLALAAFTQAQDAEATVSGITEMGQSLADKAKATFEDIRNSDIVSSSQAWLEQQLEKVKQKI
ncbi:hypothetical protein JOQ06_022769, partial [Pogonophryne albipinna]